MAHAYPQQSMWSGRRLVVLLGAIAVNLGMILAINNGLSLDVLEPKPEPFTPGAVTFNLRNAQ